MNIAEHICNYLALYKVKHIFGYPGAAILPLMDAINRHEQLDWILMRHESSAALAASAYGKLTQNISVCIASSGPGASNLITGMLDANVDFSPVLAITGLTSTIKHGLPHFQCVDQLKLLDQCCGFNALCEHPSQISQLLQAAIGYIIRYHRPAHLAIAADLQLTKFNKSELAFARKHYKQLHQPIQLLCPPDEAIRIVADTINASEKIIIAVGARARGAGRSIEALSEKISAPIVCTFAGKGVVRENHPNYFGVLGLFGSPANRHAFHCIKEAKVVLSFGADELVYFLTDKHVDQIRELIQCEPDINLLGSQFIQKKFLLGDIHAITEKLMSTVLPRSHEIKKIKQHALSKTTTLVHQDLFFKTLNTFLHSEKTIIALDIGDCIVWAIQYLVLKAYQNVLVSNRIGTMGFCLPALIAAKLAKPDHLVIGICGDGGFQMVLAEILSAKQHKLNIVLFVFCNNVLQRVAAQQHDMYGTGLLNPDYLQLAQSCHIAGIEIRHNDEIEAKLELAFSITEGPVLVAVHTDPEVYAPMIHWEYTEPEI